MCALELFLSDYKYKYIIIMCITKKLPRFLDWSVVLRRLVIII